MSIPSTTPKQRKAPPNWHARWQSSQEQLANQKHTHDALMRDKLAQIDEMKGYLEGVEARASLAAEAYDRAEHRIALLRAVDYFRTKQVNLLLGRTLFRRYTKELEANRMYLAHSVAELNAFDEKYPPRRNGGAISGLAKQSSSAAFGNYAGSASQKLQAGD